MSRRIRANLGLITLFLVLFMGLSAAQAAPQTLDQLIDEGDTAGVWALVTPKYGVEYIQRWYAKLVITPSQNPVFAAVTEEVYPPQFEYSLTIQEVNGVGFTIEAIDSYCYFPESNSFSTGFPLNMKEDT